MSAHRHVGHSDRRPYSEPVAWLPRAEAVFEALIAEGEAFTADDLVERAGHLDDLHESGGGNNAIGAMFAKASKSGRIIAVGYVKSRTPSRKGGSVRQWRAAP